jgi:hypothetical protein
MKNVVLTILWLFLLSAKSTFAITPIAAYITSPTNSSSLSGNSQVFHFEDPDNIVFSLYVGLTPGDYDLGYYPGLKGSNSVDVTDLPIDGSLIFLTLYSRNNGEWLTQEYIYTATQPGIAAYFTSPSNGSILTGSSQIFHFEDPNNIVFSLYVGSTPGDYDLGYYPDLQETNSVNVTNLPDGRPIFLTLYSRSNGEWLTQEYFYRSSIAAFIASPITGSILSGSSQIFQFEDPNNIVFSLYVGSTPGDYDLGYYPGLNGTNSVNVTNLPTDGSKIYLTLYSRINGRWLTRANIFTASQPNNAAYITSPDNGSTLSGSSQVFHFEDPDNIAFSLYVGSTPGDFDLGYYPGLKGSNSVNVTNLPTDGSNVYLTLYSRDLDEWKITESSYTSANFSNNGDCVDVPLVAEGSRIVVNRKISEFSNTLRDITFTDVDETQFSVNVISTTTINVFGFKQTTSDKSSISVHQTITDNRAFINSTVAIENLGSKPITITTDYQPALARGPILFYCNGETWTEPSVTETLTINGNEKIKQTRSAAGIVNSVNALINLPAGDFTTVMMTTTSASTVHKEWRDIATGHIVKIMEYDGDGKTLRWTQEAIVIE